MGVVELSPFYAADLALAIRAMFYLTLFAFAAAVIFGALYLSFRPRLRRAIRTNGKLLARIDRLKLTSIEQAVQSRTQIDRIAELEDIGVKLVKETLRVDAIRKKTELRCSEFHDENDRLRLLVGNVDITELERERHHDEGPPSASWITESEIAALTATGAANSPSRKVGA